MQRLRGCAQAPHRVLVAHPLATHSLVGMQHPTLMGNRRGIKHRLIGLRCEFPKPAGVTGRCKMGPDDYVEGGLSR
jgi:hypothetical protein